MNILAITKFPPIQGGESNKAFYLFKELGNRGHQVFVVTNSNDVANKDKVQFSEKDFSYLTKNNNLNIYNPEIDNIPSFIPQFDPKTEKLINEGLRIISEQKIDIIYGWYFLPYISAAYVLSKITSIPLVIQHAGSDLKRILPNRNLNFYFENIIREAFGILTYYSCLPFFKNKRSDDILIQKAGFPDIYNHEGTTVDFEKEFNIKCSPNSTFLCLGKFSKGKGFYEIIEAFKKIENATLLILTPSRTNVEIEIPKNVFVLDAVAPWRVPEIIRSVKAVIVPEWNFGVEIHKSRLPIEAILCGKTALVSNQIIDNYFGLKSFMIPIETPNHNDTISKINYVIQNTFINDNIKQQAKEIRKSIVPFETYVNEIEVFLLNKATS